MKQDNCKHCKNTGIQKYQPIEELTHYRWMPWKQRPCPHCNNYNNK